MGEYSSLYEKIRKKNLGESTPASGKSSSGSSGGTYSSAYEKIKNAHVMRADVDPTITVDDSYISKFFDDYNRFVSSASESYKGIGYGNAGKLYDDYGQQGEDLRKRGDAIKRYLWANRGAFGDEYDSIADSIEQMMAGQRSIVDSYRATANNMNLFDSEDDYNQYVQRQQNYQDKWGHYVDAPDYADYSARGAAIKNPTMSEAERGITVFGKQIGGADVGNIVTYSRDNHERIGMGEANGSTVVGKSLYHYMTDDEVGIYNYLLAKEGGESAQAYLDDLEEDLNFRMGTAQAGTILSMDNPVVRAAAIAATSVGSGVDQWGSGIRQMLSNEKLPTSSAQFGSSVIAENLDGVGRYAYLAGNTIGNMAPSILLSSLTAGLGASASVAQGVGNFALGASAAGNAYGQALADGYSTEQARTYGVFVGASEALLQHLLGGIGSLGGVTSGKIMSKVAAIDNSLLRIAAKVGVSIGSEITEEELQSFLEPAFRSILFGEDYDAPTIEELLETAVVTAMSTGLLEGPSNIGGDIANSRYYKSNYGDVAQELVAEGLESPDGSVSKTLAQKYQEILNGNGSLNGHQLGRMVEANEQQFTADDMTAMESAAAQRLTELGETGDVSAIGKALAKQAAGEKLTRAETAAIQSSKYGQRVANEMTPNNIESGEYSTDWAQQIGTNRVNAESYNAGLQALAAEMTGAKPADSVPAEAGPETATSVGDSTPKPVMPVTERFTASGEGKTSIADMGKVQIASTEGGKMTLKTESGQTVKAEDVSFRSEDEAMVYSAVLDMGVSPVVAQSIVDNFDGTDGRLYAEDVKLAYQYGKMNFPKSYLEKLDIKPHQAEHAYNLGRSDAKAEVFAPKTKRTVKGKRGTVTFETAVDESTLKPIQRESLNGIKAIADLSGLNVHVFMSDRDNGFRYTMPDGAVTTANGWYIPGTNEIWIDLNAGKTGEGTMLYTFAHEISHYIKDWSPAKWRVMADFLLEQYGEDVPLDALLQRQMDKISKRDPSLKGNALMDAAYEELVSDAMSEMLVDGEVAQKLAELKQKDRTLWEKIKEAIHNLLERWGLIRKEYEGKTPDAGEAQFLRGMDDAFKKLQQLYTEAFAEASDNFAAAAEEVLQSRAKPVSDSEIVTDGAVVVDGNGNKFSIRSMKADIAEGKMFDDLMKYCGWSQARVNELRRQLTDLVAYMEPHRDILDMNESYGREGRKFSPYKPNSDPLYQISMDFSTLCSKRLLTQYVIENLQLRENRPMSAEEQMAIRDMLIEYRQVEKGLQVACAMCYVEAARLKSPKQMQRWLNDPAPLLRDYFGKANKAFNDSVKEAQADFKESRGYARNTPKKDMKAADVRELNKIGPKMRAEYQLSEEEQKIVDRAKALPNSTYLTAGNLANLSETDPVIYHAYTSFVRTATRSKSLETDEPYYYGDSTRDNGNGIIVSDSFIEAVNRENGMRFSSWSDWRIQHLLDYITAVIDNSVRGAAMHGYTKFAEEVRVLGKTGMMFNLSGVAGTQTGLNEDGSLNFSQTESIDINDAIELREEFPETAGLQCIGVSDDHIFALLRSDVIDYVIPYHVSGLNKGLRRMADIHGWKDYTDTQHAAIDKSVKNTGQEHWHEEPVYSEFFVGYDTGMTGEEAMQESARRYVEMCRERGLTPKFEKFVNEPGYWKLLVDRKMINQKTGELIQQKPVTPTFDFDAIRAVVDRYVENYDSGLEARALNYVVKNWDSVPGRIRDLKKGGTKKTKSQQALDTLYNEMMAAQPTEGGEMKLPDRDAEAVEFSDNTTKFSIRDEAPPKKVGVAYKVFLAKDGQLYPPMVANPGGEGTPVGVWLNADIGKAGPPSKSGRPQVQGGGKGTNSGKISLAFRPGWHLGDIPLAKQFARLNPETGKKELFPANFVWAECEYAMDVDYQEEAMSYGYTENGKFRHSYAGLPKLPADGYYRYRTNPNPDTVPWVITGAMRVKRILTDAETDAICRENGVEPMARQGGPINLSDFGLNAGEVKLSDRDITEDPLFPPTEREAGVFKRSYMNKAGALKPGEARGIIINTGAYMYIVKAVGSSGHNPFTGEILEKTSADTGDTITAAQEELRNETYKPTEEDYLAYQAAQRNGRRGSHRHRSLKERLAAEGYAHLLDDESDGNSDGNRRQGGGAEQSGGVKLSDRDTAYQAEADINRLRNEIESIDDEMLFAGGREETTLRNKRVKLQGQLDKLLAAERKATKRTSLQAVLDNLETYRRSDLESIANQLTDGAWDDIEDLSTDALIDGIREVINDRELSSLEMQATKFGVYVRDVSNWKLSERDTDSVSHRDLLAGAFESIAQNDIERGKIAEYQQKVKQLNEQEQKLAEIRKELGELSFAKGPRDNDKIRKLREEATKISNRIGIYDKQLLRLEASAPLMAVLEREKKLAYSRASQKWADRMETARTGRNKTEMRHKIKGIVSELNQLLLHGSKDKHVMIGLQKATAEALSAINMDTVAAEERLAKIQAKIDRATDPAEIAKLQQTYARIEEMGMNMNARLAALKNAYEDIKDSGDPLIAGAYQPEIEERIKNLRKMVGETPLRNMSMEQLEFTYDTYKMVLTTIRNANKAFKNERGETIAVLGNKAMQEIETVGGKHPLAMKAMKGPLSFAWSGLKPTYAFKAIGSDTLSEMFENVRAGEDTWAVDVSEAKEFYRQKTQQYHFDSWDMEKQYSFTSKTGKEFKLTLEQIMSLYAYSKRKQADAHLDKGGFVFDDAIEVVQKKHGIPVKYTVKTADAHNLSRDTLMAICKTLTDEQVKFVDEMQEYLSTVMGEKGNEVSLEMYGVKLFKEKFYFPLKSAKQYMFEQNEVAGEVKIKNSGFSKETVQHASNPVILSNFTDVWASHVNDMAMYHAFVLPLEDFNRVFNYKTPNDANLDTESVKMFLQNAYGRQPEQYIRQLLTDLNGGARSDPNAGIINKLIGIFKKSAVFASMSVVVQQPSAIARAAAYIDTKYFVGKPSAKAWEEVKKYAPVAIIKEMGYFDTNMGVSTTEFIKAKEYHGAKAKMAALVTDSQYRDEILSKAPAVADELAWCQIWEAVKKETAAKGLKGEELLQAAGKRFTEVIVNTQVYDSVLSRSGMMRSKDTGVKMATSFMAEPTTSLNMITDALIQGKRGNKSYARKAIGSVIASMILNSILVSFVYAGRDDDEDKTYAEKYVGTLTGELIDSFNPLTMIPFVKDIVSIAQGYDVERSDMAVVTDLYKAWKNLSNENRSTYRKVEDFGGAVAAIFGLPVKNIMRDLRGMYNTVMSFVDGTKTTGRGVGEAARENLPKLVGGGERSNSDELYHAMLRDDAKHTERVKARFKDERAVAYAIRDGLVANDKRITAAAEARVAGDQSEYLKLAREIVGEGHFTQDDVVRAINYVTDKLRKGETESASSLSAPDTFKVEDYYNEVVSNDQAEAEVVKREIISGMVADGKTAEEAEKSFNNSFKNSAVKPAFIEGDIAMDRAIAMLQKYGGLTEDAAAADVEYWAFSQNYPNIPVEDSWFDAYYKYAADVNIPVDTYMTYRNDVRGITGDGKKARRMAVIDSMPLTSAQKDALYYSEGWAASTIWEAPWH